MPTNNKKKPTNSKSSKSKASSSKSSKSKSASSAAIYKRTPFWIAVVAILLIIILVACYFLIKPFNTAVNNLFNKAVDLYNQHIADDIKGYELEDDATLPALAAPEGDLTVEFLDVGQGDAIFLSFPDGKHMLIDAGTMGNSTYYAKKIIDYMKTKTDRLDYLVLTHSDQDHINMMDDVIKAFDTGILYTPKLVDSSYHDYTGQSVGSDFAEKGYGIISTGIYKSYNDAVVEKYLKKEINVRYAEEGQVITNQESSYRITLLAPQIDVYKDVTAKASAYAKNAVSSILILEYAGVKVCLTGDATGFDTEGKADTANIGGTEKAFLEYIQSKGLTSYVDCDILKLGHHGSRSSSSQAFLDVIKPEYAVICVGPSQGTGTQTYSAEIDYCFTKSNVKYHSMLCKKIGNQSSCSASDEKIGDTSVSRGNTYNLPNDNRGGNAPTVLDRVRPFTKDSKKFVNDDVIYSEYRTDDENIFATDEKGDITLTIKESGTFDFKFEYENPPWEAWQKASTLTPVSQSASLTQMFNEKFERLGLLTA